jgi:hypothetical protein
VWLEKNQIILQKLKFSLFTQVVFHTYRYWNDDITKKQLIAYIGVNVGSGTAAAGGAIAGAIGGAALGSIVPGIGTGNKTIKTIYPSPLLYLLPSSSHSCTYKAFELFDTEILK